MIHKLLVIVFISFSSIMLGQVYEVGVTIGGTNYVGDIGETTYINPNKLGGALLFKYNWNPRIALRGTFSFLPIEGNDKYADTNYRNNRGLRFTNTIHELAAGLEWNFYEYDITDPKKSWTPYILVEFAAFNYKIIDSERAPGEYNFKNKNSFAIPFGVGFKSKLYRNLAFSIETKVRYTFEDDLDYNTDKVPALNFGGNSNDWYMFTGVSLIYTFGRPACYTEGF